LSDYNQSGGGIRIVEQMRSRTSQDTVPAIAGYAAVNTRKISKSLKAERMNILSSRYNWVSSVENAKHCRLTKPSSSTEYHRRIGERRNSPRDSKREIADHSMHNSIRGPRAETIDVISQYFWSHGG
jgi:hypothetical protein